MRYAAMREFHIQVEVIEVNYLKVKISMVLLATGENTCMILQSMTCTYM